MTPTLDACIDRIRTAAARREPLCIRGGGSKDFYGGPLVGERLDTRALNGVIAYEPSELYVRAWAGTPLAHIESLLAERGQCLPFEPPHFAAPGAASTATLGGMVAAGLAGPARAAVGSVRDYVLGLSLVNGQGQPLRFGGQVMKNVAGYDVSRVMAGALGTLGLITEVTLKVLPVAVAERTLRFECDEAAAIHQLNVWGGQPLPVNASCWVDGVLHVRLRGARAAVEAAGLKLGGQPLPDATAAALWGDLREQRHAFFTRAPERALWRVAVPDTTPPLGLGPTLVEWGGAQRWVSTDSASLRPQVGAESGGHATLFRAAEKLANAFAPLAPPLDRLHRALKAEFDPAGIFNPGRLHPDF